LKKEKPWYKGVYSQVLQNALQRLDQAFQKKRKTTKLEKDKDFPKYKKRGNWDSITYPQFIHRPKNNKITVAKIGDIKIVYHREIAPESVIKTLMIAKEAGKWFACFSFEIPEPEPDSELDLEIELKQPNYSSPIGIDLGLIDFFYTSDGDVVKAPRFLRKSEARLKKLQTQLSKTKKRTPKYFKILNALQKVHYKIKCQRTDFLHKQANFLLSISDLIVHEDLDIMNMMRKRKKASNPLEAKQNTGRNKSISDVGWSKFLKILAYKAEELGTKVVAIDPSYTSQDCSGCGERIEKSLSTRTHHCHVCGLSMNRDLNAALNILRLGLESLGLWPLEAPTIPQG
ncbi:MAG: putative transposase, partial [bacterium]